MVTPPTGRMQAAAPLQLGVWRGRAVDKREGSGGNQWGAGEGPQACGGEYVFVLNWTVCAKWTFQLVVKAAPGMHSQKSILNWWCIPFIGMHMWWGAASTSFELFPQQMLQKHFADFMHNMMASEDCILSISRMLTPSSRWDTLVCSWCASLLCSVRAPNSLFYPRKWSYY